MNAFNGSRWVCVLVGLLASTTVAVNIETVPVGNPGNAADTRYETPHYGSVGYTYNIGKYEVTAGQYREFLEAVAKTDMYGLYNSYMANTEYGSGISRSGSSGSYTYSVDAAFVNRPVNFVSYWDACRFANWLHNGQPTGAQGAGTTETGAYTLNGYNGTDGRTIQRNDGWKWAVTSEDEWYKAAYHKNDGVTANYFDYPTSSDAFPGRDLNDVSGNNANYYRSPYPYPIDPPYYTTVVGEFQNSDSPYGTFDQGGNVWEWTESVAYGSSRVYRGGSFNHYVDYLHALIRDYHDPASGDSNFGFRVVQVPEPASLLLLALGGMAVMRRVRRLGVAVSPVVLAALLFSAASTRADVFDMPPGLTSLETVPVGNPGNAGELSGQGAGGFGSDRVCGAVAYEYRIGKYEVTAGQYCEFLNAAARTDTYELYNERMSYVDGVFDEKGCNIRRSGSPGTYTYSVPSDWANRPVNLVSWADAARFANWLTNGQPTGPQNLSTTEDGSYYLNGATGLLDLMAVTRKANARYVIPTEDEWYKAAYYDPTKPGGAGYWSYPTRSETVPTNVLSSAGVNNANYYDYYYYGNGGYTVGGPYWRTEVGAFGSSTSLYGTFDQGGNVAEWNEAIPYTNRRGLRGGAFCDGVDCLQADYIGSQYPYFEYNHTGFRVAYIPEPATLTLDILPDNCPNDFTVNPKGKGRLPMAILGSATFDVSTIDVNTISIAKVAFPVKAPSMADVSAPADGEECACQTGTDGYPDLILHFSRRAVIQALGLDTMASGTVVPITVEGQLLDGTPFEATDCVTLVGRK